MSRAPFRFKQFSITAHDAGMAVSTDGVLLGAWSSLEKSQSILDLGTGTGLLALMAAQRNPRASITAIDIEPSAIKAAQQNIARSPWQSRITLHQQDATLLAYGEPMSRQDSTAASQKMSLPKDRFEHIICNPPYFETGETSQDKARATARHTDSLTQQQLARSCRQLLANGGCASFILPTFEGERFIEQLSQQGLTLSRLTKVQTTPIKPVSRLLIECQQSPEKYCEDQLVIQQNGHYSEAFTQLTRAFYLKMPN
jgi:tRNA1Val (adenine37-N6)-methyltransferase